MDVIEKLKKGEISISLASELMGMSVPELIRYLKGLGIKPFEADVSDIELVDTLLEGEQK